MERGALIIGWILSIAMALTVIAVAPVVAQDRSITDSQIPSLESDTPRLDQDADDADDDDDDDDSQLLTRWLKLDKVGLEVDGTWIYDQTSILFGGIEPGKTAGQNLLNLSVSADLEKICGIEGGELFLLFQSHRGINASELAGDEQFFDQLDTVPSPARGEISELWYQQFFCDRKVRIKLGKVDCNSEFAYVANGFDFLHGAFGNAPTIFIMPTYPDTATAANLFIYPSEHLYAGAGIYDGALARGITTGQRGPETFFRSPHEYFLIGEAGVNYTLGPDKLAGRIGAGYWYHTGKFVQFESIEREELEVGRRIEEREVVLFDVRIQQGTYGAYVVWDQQLWKENPGDDKDKQGIAAFYQFGSADPDITLFEIYHGAGIVWAGFFDGRDEDTMGAGIAFSNFSALELPTDPHPANEIAYQIFYKYKMGDHLTVQPNLSYVHDPGESKSLRDPLAFTLRVLIDF